MASNFQKNVDVLMNRLDSDETDINKICDVTHNVLMAMSIRDGVDIINNNKKKGEMMKIKVRMMK